VFDQTPYIIRIAWESPDRRDSDHIFNIARTKPNLMALIEEWMRTIGIPLGKIDNDGNIIEYGVITRHTERRTANLLLFEYMRKSLPEWPWPFRSKIRKGFGLV
jgi:hypothetical protein